MKEINDAVSEQVWVRTKRISNLLRILRSAFKLWGTQVLYVFDRGFAGALWLHLLLRYHFRFVVAGTPTTCCLMPSGRNTKPGKSVATNAL